VTSGERPSAPVERRPAGAAPKRPESEPGAANGGEASSERPRLVEKLLRGRERHKRRSKAVRAAWVIAGFLVIAGGLAIAPLPGPGPLILVPLGLAMLALEFVWAERLLERSLTYANRAKEGATGLSRRQKLLAIVLALAVVAVTYAVAAWLFELPEPFPG
jgi:uncharacterized protein (TIGR02611 family)